MELKERYFINIHKTLTPFVIILLMVYHENYSLGPVLYLALHGTYCLNWLLKELVFPDKGFDRKMHPIMFFLGLIFINGYWISPYIVVTKETDPHMLTVLLAVSSNILGTYLHFCSDVQKYFVLQHRSGLITDGFFARCRHTNYAGEVMTYLGFCLLSEHWMPFVNLLFMFCIAFLPAMRRKEKSLSRYEQYAEYCQKTNMMFPKLF